MEMEMRNMRTYVGTTNTTSSNISIKNIYNAIIKNKLNIIILILIILFGVGLYMFTYGPYK